MQVRPANREVFELVEKVKTCHHLPRLEEANIAVSIAETKPFVRGRFNWGKVAKFGDAQKIWHPENKKYDFHITLCDEAWNILAGDQKEALIDLHLTCCQVEYMPEMVVESGKKKPAKDRWGRVVYTDQVRLDDEGRPKWKVAPLDLNVFQENVSRYGCWCQDLLDLKAAIKNSDLKQMPFQAEM